MHDPSERQATLKELSYALRNVAAAIDADDLPPAQIDHALSELHGALGAYCAQPPNGAPLPTAEGSA